MRVRVRLATPRGSARLACIRLYHYVGECYIYNVENKLQNLKKLKYIGVPKPIVC